MAACARCGNPGANLFVCTNCGDKRCNTNGTHSGGKDGCVRIPPGGATYGHQCKQCKKGTYRPV
jgi:hypothetical protein